MDKEFETGDGIEAIPDVGPNVSHEEDSFFESDHSIESKLRRQKKKVTVEHLGAPFKCPSKVLAMCPSSHFSNQIYVAESGHITRLVRLKDGKTMRMFRGHKGPVTCLAVLPASTTGLHHESFISGSWDKLLILWNSETGEVVQKYGGHRDFVKCVYVFAMPPSAHHQSSDATQLSTKSRDASLMVASGSSDRTVRVYYALDGVLVKAFNYQHPRGIEHLVIVASSSAENSLLLITACSDGQIRKIAFDSGEVLMTVDGHLTSVYRCILHDESLWTASADGSVRQWNIDTGIQESLFQHENWAKAVAFFGNYVITGSQDEKIRIWNRMTDTCVHVIDGHADEVSCFYVDKATHDLFSGSYDATIRRWPLLSILKTLSGSPVVAEVPCVPKEQELLTAEEEKELNDLLDDEE